MRVRLFEQGDCRILDGREKEGEERKRGDTHMRVNFGGRITVSVGVLYDT